MIARLDHSYNCRSRASFLRWTASVWTWDISKEDSTFWDRSLLERGRPLRRLTLCHGNEKRYCTRAVRQVRLISMCLFEFVLFTSTGLGYVRNSSQHTRQQIVSTNKRCNSVDYTYTNCTECCRKCNELFTRK